MRLKYLITALILALSVQFVWSQDEILKIADDHIEKGNYQAAYNIFKRVAEKDTLNAKANYGAGISILNLAMNQKTSIGFLERALRAGIKDDDAMFYMGLAYHYNLQYDMADAAFREYQAAGKGNMLHQVGRLIENVENAKKLCQAPIDVTFENAGFNINSEYPDYYPMITPDESFIAFTSRRKSNVGARLEFDGFYPSDILMSRVVDGEFAMVENAGRSVNTPYDEQLVGLSVDADQLFVYSDNIKDYGNIYFSNYSDGSYGPKIIFDEVINSKEFESSATISSDHATLFFASNREGGFGGKDLYMTRKLPTGQWARPQNLGNKINTKYNEDFPYLFFDGQTLYFASEGHNSIGGYDVFKSTWDSEENVWSDPVNLGYPVNTPQDNMNITFTEDQRHAYISCYRSDSKGNLDIYRVSFLDKDPRETIYKSKVVREGSEVIIKDATVLVMDNLTEEEVGSYMPDPKTGSLIMALPPGSYHLTIEAAGYRMYETDIIVKGKSDFKDFQLQDFIVSPR